MSTATKRTKAATKAKPALHVQVGSVRMAIWQNEGKDGPYFIAGQPELSYKKDGEWKTGTSYGPRDLVNLLKVAALAHSELMQRNRPQQDIVGPIPEPEV